MTEDQNRTKGPDETNAAGQGEEERNETPHGATPAGDLFDLMGDEGRQFKKPEPRKKAAGQTTGADEKKYPAGMEIHHAGHKVALGKEMTEAEVFGFLSDDFPEVTADRAEIREDKQKNRLVVAFKSFKKGKGLRR